MNLLQKYKNGNVLVSIYEDGTKIQEWDGVANPTFPNSMDIKITNYCDLNCSFCHEMSTTKGKHGDLDKLSELLVQLPQGTELAIGGGDPLSHPDLLDFLCDLSQVGLIPNMTVNIKHVKKNINLINNLIEDKLIYGLGVSISDDSDLSVMKEIVNPNNVVYHVIAGVNDIDVLTKIQKEDFVKKALILGYKEVGRGKTLSEKTNSRKDRWNKYIKFFIGKMHLSFDNLAVRQLNIKDLITVEAWEEFYMGDDGQFTMYIDAVEEKYTVSSTTAERYDLINNMREIFDHIKRITK